MEERAVQKTKKPLRQLSEDEEIINTSTNQHRAPKTQRAYKDSDDESNAHYERAEPAGNRIF